MKKRIIIAVIALLLMAGIVLYCSTFRINLNFAGDGALKSEGTFTISFSGSDKYTDEELAAFLFEKDIQANPFVFLWNDKFGEHVQIPFIEEYDVEMKSLTSYEVTFYEKSIVGYIEYMGSYKYFDKDGIVVESSATLLADIPYVTGIDVDYIVLHSKLPVNDESVFDILLDVTQLISKYEIPAERINISDDMEIRLYLGEVKVELGKTDNLSNKIMDLRDILPQLVDVKGVLDMKVYDSQGKGYTFKKDQ